MSPSLDGIASRVIVGYIRRSPLERGKWRLLKWASSFLTVEIEPGTLIRVSDPFDSVQAAIVRKGLLEADDAALFLGLARPGMTVFDIGANLGMYTLLLARRVGPDGAVHAFEPTPRVAASLVQNVALNRLLNVSVNRTAVTDAVGTATFYLTDDSDRNSLAGGHGEPATIETTTIDAYVTANQINAVELMKIDVEGAETRVLRGAVGLLTSERPPALMVELNPSALARNGTSAPLLLDLLHAYGYRCHRLASYGNGAYSNVLALKAWHHDFLNVPREVDSGPP